MNKYNKINITICYKSTTLTIATIGSTRN